MEKREKTIKSKEGSHSEPTNRRERRKQKNVKKKHKTKKKNLHKHSLYIRKEIELKQREMSLPIKY